MLEQAADVPARQITEPAVAALVVEQRLTVAPQRLVCVHAGTVVAEQGLWHECCRLAPLVCGVLDDVLELQDVISRVHHRVEAVVDLSLPAAANLVVGTLKNEAGVDELEADVVAKVGLLVNRAHREVSALEWRLVGEVSALLDSARVPRALLGVDGEEAFVLRCLIANVVEDVELRFWGEECRVGDAGGCKVLFGLLRDLARVAGVDFTVAGIVDVKEHDQRCLGAERVEVGRCHIRNQLHI